MLEKIYNVYGFKFYLLFSFFFFFADDLCYDANIFTTIIYIFSYKFQLFYNITWQVEIFRVKNNKLLFFFKNPFCFVAIIHNIFKSIYFSPSSLSVFIRTQTAMVKDQTNHEVDAGLLKQYTKYFPHVLFTIE